MSDELGFDPTRLLYIKTRSETDKRAMETWGGYSQDYDAAECVYTHDEVVESDHDHWGVCGVQDMDHRQLALLVFDLDIHKAPEDFDPETISVPENTLITKSQNGGFHVYFVVHAGRGDGSESDFEMTKGLGWDIDIRGSYVNHHVVAPSDIPGVGGLYEVVNDTDIMGVFDPADAAERIQHDGEPLLEYDSATGIGDFEFDRDVEPPEDMPKCYHSGLQLRAACPDDHPNTHKVNTLTALCGLAAGYSLDDMVTHFVDEYAPGDYSDTQETRYQLEHMAAKMERGSLAPPSVSTLRDWGILDTDDTCDCSIDYHGGTIRDTSLPTDMDDTSDDRPDITWQNIQTYYKEGDTKFARYYAAQKLLDDNDYMTPDAGEAVFEYHAPTGIFERGARHSIKQELARELGPFYSQHEAREIVGRIRDLTYVDRDELNAGGEDTPLLCVENGVLDLETFELRDHSPEYCFTRGVHADYDPDATCPTIDSFMDDITDRMEDKLTMYEMVGNALLPHYDYESFLVLYGDGGNGKSTFYSLVRTLLGNENVSGATLQQITDNRFAASTLVDKMANVAPDMPSTKIKEIGDVKALTGGDAVQVEKKGEQAFEFVNSAKLMFGCNEPPVIEERTDAVKRRILPIHLPHRFTEKENDGNPMARDRTKLMDELTATDELSGFLNMAIAGIKRLRQNSGFSLPESPSERLELYEKHSDPIKEFGLECLENKTGSQVSKADVYNAYTNFCHERDYTVRSDSVFFRQLRQTAFNYAEVRPNGGERMLNNAAFTDAGDSHSPAETGGSTPDDGHQNTITPLADATPADGYVTITAEVRSLTTDTPDAITQSGVLMDESDIVDFVAWDSTVSEAFDIEEDACYRFENVKMGYDQDGAPQLELTDVTEVTAIDKGAMTTISDAPDDNQQETLADGGTDDSQGALIQDIANTVRKKDTGDGVPVKSIAGTLMGDGYDHDRVQDAVAKAKRTGVLHAPDDDDYVRLS